MRGGVVRCDAIMGWLRAREGRKRRARGVHCAMASHKVEEEDHKEETTSKNKVQPKERITKK